MIKYYKYAKMIDDDNTLVMVLNDGYVEFK